MTWQQPRKLTRLDDLEGFDCGSPELTVWLRQYALPSQRSGMSTVFVATSGERVVGYYALTMGGVAHDKAPPRVSRHQPRYPIPVIVLARVGVDMTAQRKGLGRALVVDALRRADSVSQAIGCRALPIHAKDDQARAFYRGLAEFEPSPTGPLHLYLLTKDLRALLA